MYWFGEAEAGDLNMWITNNFGAKNNIIILIFHFKPTIWPQAGINIMNPPPPTRVTRHVSLLCSGVSSECSII